MSERLQPTDRPTERAIDRQTDRQEGEIDRISGNEWQASVKNSVGLARCRVASAARVAWRGLADRDGVLAGAGRAVRPGAALGVVVANRFALQGRGLILAQ